ncbi:MAG: mannose-phosphate guanyltransferase [Haloplasmataceae bacterium]|jgi:mannose-1-phosphate guanylyltransferase|nr:mannose-phosphate guanyltransferase [Haloplasmataceae bacterium]
MLTAFIMAGGSGERFWPLSTKEKPKQLLNLVSDKTMIRETVDRILPLIPVERIYIGTNAIQAALIKKELYDIPNDNIIIEPSFKDTAAAIGFGTTVIQRKFPEATIVVLASDHLIVDEENFRQAIVKASIVAKDGFIVTLGIKPNKPETGYGYIELKENLVIGQPVKSRRFLEKPNLERATEYVESGHFLWNSGMFVFTINTLFSAFNVLANDHFNILKDIKNKIQNKVGIDLANIVKADFEKFEKISIDFAIMEKANNIMVIPVDFGWNDVGSFPSLDEVFEKNENGSVIRTSNVIEVESSNNIIINEGKKKIIATVGIKDLVIVETDDALLVCDKEHSQYIKKVLAKLK